MAMSRLYRLWRKEEDFNDKDLRTPRSTEPPLARHTAKMWPLEKTQIQTQVVSGKIRAEYLTSVTET